MGRSLRHSVNKRLAALVLAGRSLDLSNLEKAAAVWPEQRLIYNRLKKSGNTRIVAFLNDELGGGQFDSARRLKAALVRPFDLPLGELARLDRFFSFTIVRNPYSRVLSAYLDKLAEARTPGATSRRQPDYGRFPGYGENSPEGFARFLDFLADGGLRANRHWWPQADLLYQPAERFSFIGRLETMAADMGRVLEAVGRDPAAAAALDRRHDLEAGRRETRTAEREAAFYTPRGRAIVARLHARDFALFGYPT
jgi:hypothetical protein